MSDRSASQQEQPKILILSGPSGSGKTTIVNRLMENQPVRLVKSVSATTRLPREGERDGVDYHFLTRETFETKLEQDEFLEHAEVFKSGNLYGTLWTEIERASAQQSWSFLEIDVEGALKVMERFPDALTIFLRTPSEEVFEQRLRDRGTESEEMIQRRVATARSEMEFADRYRYQIVNDILERTVDEISDILVKEESQANA